MTGTTFMTTAQARSWNQTHDETDAAARELYGASRSGTLRAARRRTIGSLSSAPRGSRREAYLTGALKAITDLMSEKGYEC